MSKLARTVARTIFKLYREILDHVNIVLLVLKAIHKTDVLGIAKEEQGFTQYFF